MIFKKNEILLKSTNKLLKGNMENWVMGWLMRGLERLTTTGIYRSKCSFHTGELSVGPSIERIDEYEIFKLAEIGTNKKFNLYIYLALNAYINISSLCCKN